MLKREREKERDERRKTGGWKTRRKIKERERVGRAEVKHGG